MSSSRTREPEPQEMQDGEPLMPANFVDVVAFGRRLRALRIVNGFDRAEDFARQMRSHYGVDVSKGTVYAIERGEQMPHIDFFFAAISMLDSEQDYFAPAIRRDVVDRLRKKGYGA